ncbi:MAG: UDP-3-O-acyl-N-acetylglucosamine deacetylase [Microcystis sp. M54BS1]|uniref:UDP-3-O-acyl-N-acetylglucosamine deacetylase n=1 Tax=unclassified Microcystis TaxID=2643300 RepID=UPI001DDB9D28|nr:MULTISPECIES: UDP-3-O-acyl-N-acetylglucosamine deacetylase [unclassified Microcystis]MBE5232183.1 UDP-3-O-acyl-N-acetylglucosamine deacetylase [Microcystis aeruginosa PMC 728.11]MCA2542312.1 UDP-3-O-acyl-N-acetylglucosamine deacetylase [Microcystis sp. M54BS1]MCA2593924.1 UDP-3-O-acyl-N-acetylglucosamine deacetylase [Microcystis sp. M38BS1]MCA2612673.1 UDP-3-O-acyl-N-acetylglucosamine deacetylase [Microcystis sp. M27BS1]NCS30330.1 UDP-3-O-acyl-N-acetylglucosamine deacetylase [Microcystis ae
MVSTIAKQFELSGIGLHSGEITRVRVCGANPGEGRYFVRRDLANQPIIPALVSSVYQTTLSTELRRGEAKVRTVEHLLAALTALGVEDARIEVDGAEIPLLDGSAKIWVEAIENAGLNNSFSPSDLTISQPIWLYEGDAFVAAIPSPELRFTYGIDFTYKPIGNQWYSWSPDQESFSQAIASARTFGFADQIEYLQKAGLIKGGSLENALVCDQNQWLNPPLRFENEPARHKLLDLIGDLSLLGTIPTAHYMAFKASHKLHVQLAIAIQG